VQPELFPVAATADDGRMRERTGGSRPTAAVVVNPRIQDPSRLRELCERAAAASGWGSLVLLPTTPDDAGTGLARQALEAGADLVIAAGGDGTVRACAEVVAGTDVPLAIVPCGCANLTALALRIPARLDAAIQVAFAGQDRRIDLATADGELFTAMAGIGLDAAVVGATPRAAKRLAGWPAYAAAATGQLLRPPSRFTIRLDDGEPFTRIARSVTVGNSGLLPGGFRIMPDARLDDGMLDVVILAPAGLLGWASVGLRVVARSRHDDAKLERHTARRAEITAGTDLPRQADGEMIGTARSLTVAVLPGVLRVRVSPARAGQS
jgi:diacylglycerol kinase family enzyme